MSATRQLTTVSYVVYRHGANAANQSMAQTMPVGIYEGTGRTAAERRAAAIAEAAADVTVYANQWLTAEAAARVSRDDYTAAIEAGWLNV